MSDWFYRAFEDRYRGSREVIRERLKVYLPFVEALDRAAGVTALDLGCGRGEWLELLGENGFAAVGVDLDEGMLAACRERGLQVVTGDAVAQLRAHKDASVAVVSAFHLVEHIPFEQLKKLIKEALRVLRPGGLLILETPNPENLVVGTSSFYDDPSHVRPLSPKLLGFLVEFCEFARHSVLRLQQQVSLKGDAPITLFDVLAGVSPDYGIVAQKADTTDALAPLDVLFAAEHGVDLHTLAQRYQHGQDVAHETFRSQHAQQAAANLAVQQQLITIDTQIAKLHETGVFLKAELNELRDQQGAAIDILQRQLAAAETAINHVYSTGVTLSGDMDQLRERQMAAFSDADVERSVLATQITKVELDSRNRIAELERKLQYFNEMAEQAKTLSDAVVTSGAPRLRLRVETIESKHNDAVHESARLAAHVAWIEGRLGHAENGTALLRTQIAELQQHRGGIGARMLRLARGLPGNWRRLPGLRRQTPLRPAVATLLRGFVQGVLRRPALKRVARRLIGRFPGLHTRLLQLMYAPVQHADAAQADSDPLATELSPRSLQIYRALSAQRSEPKG